jgi:hypothetical protein
MREGKHALMQQLARTRAPRYFVRVNDGSCIDKIVHFYNQLLYILAIYWL